MNACEVFMLACASTAALALTCTVIVWATKHILEWLDDINDAVDTLKYIHNRRKREREAKVK